MLFSHQSKTGKTSDMISPLYAYPWLNNLLPIRSFRYCEEAVMKRSWTITVFAALMLCIISSPCAAETINPDSTTVNSIYQLTSVSTTPTAPTTARNKYILAPFSLPPAPLINQNEPRILVTGIFDKFKKKDEDDSDSKSAPNLVKFFFHGMMYVLRAFVTIIRRKN